MILLAALAVGLAVWACVPRPGERRLAEVAPVELPSWLAPVAGALPARQRGIVATALGLATGVWAGSWGVAGLALALGIGAATFLVLGRFTSAAGQRRRQLLMDALPEACDLLACAVESGLPARVAVDRVVSVIGGPMADALGGVAARVRLGLPESTAWAELASEPGLETLARELSRVVSSGIGLADLLRDLARDARQAAVSAAQVRAKKAGVRSVTPLMLCFLPAFVLLGIVPVFGGIAASVFP